jgi:hypothetical protein
MNCTGPNKKGQCSRRIVDLQTNETTFESCDKSSLDNFLED